MNKFWIIAFSLFLMGAPTMALEQSEEPELEIEAVSLNIQGNRIHICNADGKMLEVYDLTGVRVVSVKIDGNDKQVSLNVARGCYILKVGRMVRKITIR